MFLYYLFYLLFHWGAVNPDTKYWEQKLGSDVFLEREAASRTLRKSGPKALPLIHKILQDSKDLEGNSRKDPEVIVRAKRVQNQLLESLLPKFEPYPEIDTLWYVWGKGYIEYKSSVYPLYRHYIVTDDIDGTPNAWRDATRRLFEDKMRHGMPLWQLRLWWVWMHVVDHRAGYGYWQRQLYPYLPRHWTHWTQRPD